MDYKKLGLRVGLEIHQQLASQHKLFCNCQIKKSEEFPIETKRKLRVVAGELGEYDPAALYEFLRGRLFDYKSHSESSCLVELDDDPPRGINQEALKTVLQMCKLLDCEVLDEIYVMRKTVIDGSSVSGFQRTALVGMNGRIETSFGNIPIATVCVEEDSAPAIAREAGIVEYRLDRLGVPLIEIATGAEMHTPQEAKELAENIGLLLRSVSVVRGIGSIRQDINVSISGGERIEIKGFQELEKIPDIIENEAKRQASLLQIKDELHKRGIVTFSQPKDVTHIFRNTKNNFLRKLIAENGRVLAVFLPKFSGLLKTECGDRMFGKEMDSYARAYGYGIIHSDEELDKYQLADEFAELKSELSAEDRDAIIITAGKAPEKAANAILDRAKHCLLGVPKETRVADGIGSKYTRPLPGSERMYPETDVPPVRITKKLLDSIQLPQTLLEREKELSEKMPRELASQLIHSTEFPLFEELSKKVDPVLVATTLLSTIKDLRRKGYNTEKITKNELEHLFASVSQQKIPKNSLHGALIMVAEGNLLKDIEEKFAMMPEAELKKIIAELIKSNPDKNEAALMGMIMGRVKGRATGSEVIKLLRVLKK